MSIIETIERTERERNEFAEIIMDLTHPDIFPYLLVTWDICPWCKAGNSHLPGCPWLRLIHASEELHTPQEWVRDE